MRRFLAFLCAAAVCGCATLKDLDEGLKTTEGLNELSIKRLLGEPSDDVWHNDSHTLVWIYDEKGTLYLPGKERASRGVDIESGAPVADTNEGRNYACRIEADIRNQHVIDTRWSGNRGGCEKYAAKLKQWRAEDNFSLPD